MEKISTYKKIKKRLFPAVSWIRTFVKTYILVDKLFIVRQQWRRDNATRDFRFNYPLTPDSVVLDFGGYTGEWAEKISKKYACSIYIFEPVKVFFDQAKEKFKDNPKIKLFNFGLSDADSHEAISISGVASSVFVGKKDTMIKLRDVKKVIDELHLKHVNLLKINIEGGEYKVLPRMIDAGLTSMC